MTGRNQPITVGTSTSADFNRRTGRLTPSRRRKSLSVSIHAGSSGLLSRWRMFLTHPQLRDNLAEKKATPKNHAAASIGAVRPRKSVPQCANQYAPLPVYALCNPTELNPGRTLPGKTDVAEDPDP